MHVMHEYTKQKLLFLGEWLDNEHVVKSHGKTGPSTAGTSYRGDGG